MTEAERQKTEKGIEAYQEQRETLRKVIVEHKNRLHQDVFDEEFGDTTRTKNTREDIESGKAKGLYTVMFGSKRPFLLGYIEPDSFILGGLHFGDWAKWLDLLQHMVGLGEVTVEGELPDVHYCLAEVH